MTARPALPMIPQQETELGANLGRVIPLEDVRETGQSLRPLLDLVADDIEAINRIILDKAVSDVEMIPELAHHLIDSGGKRLRPMLALASARLCGYPGNGHIRTASAVEFMHTATLLHDDVVDESATRRGRKTARMIWGNQASVLVGDFLLGQAFKMFVDVGSLPVLRIMSNAAATIAEGEVMQLAAAKNTSTTEDDYLAIINAKTAALFSAAAESGAALAQRPAEEQSALRSYGKNLGLAFQLVDDALDYAGDFEPPRQIRRRRFPRGQDHASRHSLLPARHERGAAVLEPHHFGWRNQGRRSRAGRIADAQAQGDRGDLRTGAFLWRDRARCAGDLSREPREGCARTGHSFLHRPVALKLD